MAWTTVRRKRRWSEFRRENRWLFPFAGLFLLGALVGTVLFLSADAAPEKWSALLRVSGISGGFRAGLGAVWSACFSTVLWLAVLFLLGLWCCAAPFVLLGPLVQGLGLGLTEAYYYSLGWRGVLAVATVILPIELLTAAVLAMAGAESLRMSAALSRRLLPAPEGESAEKEPSFRLYCLRFAVFLVAAVGVGLLEVLLRTVLAGALP